MVDPWGLEGVLYALHFQNKPDPKGWARLGYKPRKGRWQRSFHFDIDPQTPYPHFNAEFGPFKRYNHNPIPNWLYKMGSNRALRSLGRGAVGLGIILDILDIATADPCSRGRAIGGAIGGAVGSAVGAIVGGTLVPGVGAWIGGTMGGLAGSLAGQAIGGLFDTECNCPNKK